MAHNKRKRDIQNTKNPRGKKRGGRRPNTRGMYTAVRPYILNRDQSIA